MSKERSVNGTVSPEGYALEGTIHPFWESEDGGMGTSGVQSVTCVKTSTGDYDMYDWTYTDELNINHTIITQKIPNKNGVTYTPSVSADGTITWTNDGGLPNPAPVKIVGAPGKDGANGTNGKDGYSPTASIAPITGGNQFSVTDKNGTTTVQIMNGKDGADGQPGQQGQQGEPGFSPSIVIVPMEHGHRVTVIEEAGTQEFDVVDGKDGKDGTNGTDGKDGISPTVQTETTENGTIVTINYGEGASTSFTVPNGAPGATGAAGADGVTPVITAQADITAEGELGVTVTKSGTDEAPVFTFSFTGIKGGEGGGTGGVTPTVTATATIGNGVNDPTVEVTRTGTDENPNFAFAFDGLVGKPGADGQPGENGADGMSPTITVQDIEGGHAVTITDVYGSNTFDVMDGATGASGTDGEPGKNGEPGFSPVVTVQNITGGHQVTITTASGSNQFNVMDGATGATPDVNITATQGGSTIPVTKSGTAEAPNFEFAFPGSSGGGKDNYTVTTADYLPGGISGDIDYKAGDVIIAKFVGSRTDDSWTAPRWKAPYLIQADMDNNFMPIKRPNYGVGLICGAMIEYPRITSQSKIAYGIYAYAEYMGVAVSDGTIRSGYNLFSGGFAYYSGQGFLSVIHREG